MNLDYSYVENVLVGWLKKKIEEAGARGAVVGLSGGIDSSVTAVLCKKAFPDNLLGVILPCYSSKEDIEDAEAVAQKFKINFMQKDLAPIYDQYLSILTEQEKVDSSNLTAANIKPRLRMIALYYYASQNNYLVVGTDNWSELVTGYFTKYGDGGVDIIPLGRLVKTEVWELARHLGIPHKIINKKPSAGLWAGQTDEGEMGISYKELDQYILTGKGRPDVKKRVEELRRNSAHKLAPLPIPERKQLQKE